MIWFINSSTNAKEKVCEGSKHNTMRNIIPLKACQYTSKIDSCGNRTEIRLF